MTERQKCVPKVRVMNGVGFHQNSMNLGNSFFYFIVTSVQERCFAFLFIKMNICIQKSASEKWKNLLLRECWRYSYSLSDPDPAWHVRDREDGAGHRGSRVSGHHRINVSGADIFSFTDMSALIVSSNYWRKTLMWSALITLWTLIKVKNTFCFMYWWISQNIR